MMSNNCSTALIILAAGRGTRMGQMLHTPKSLASFGGEPLLQRTLRQFHEINIHTMFVVTGYKSTIVASAAHAVYPDVRIIHNEKYIEDRNIFSLLLAMRQLPENSGVFLVEGDVVLADKTIMDLASLPLKNRSVWTACGHFQHGQSGGILLPEAEGKIQEIRYTHTYNDSLAHWYKNLGVIYIAPSQVPIYRAHLEAYAALSLDSYFMTPWQEHLDDLPAFLLDVGKQGGATFNTPEEYKKALQLVSDNVFEQMEIVLYELTKLRHIEDFDPSRSSWLAQKILHESFWTKPLAVSRTHGLVMDGQHRMEAARLLGLRYVPVIFFDYAHVPVYSLRPGYEVTESEIITRALAGTIYPYKTAKHILPHIPICNISLEQLY